MMNNKILLEKIEIKRIKNKLRNESEERDKKLKKYKPDPLMECNLPDIEMFPSDITVETSQDAVKIYPKYAYMAGDAIKNQSKQINRHKEHKLTSFFDDGDNKYNQIITNETPFDDASCEPCRYGSSFCQTNNTRSSSSSKSCFTFLQSEYPVQEFKYGKLNKEIKETMKKFNGESENLLDNSDVSDSHFFNHPVLKRQSLQSIDSSITHGAVNQKTDLCNLADDETTADVLDFANRSHAYTEAKTTAFQKHGGSLPMCSKENQITELRKYLELSVDCLLSYLESLHSSILNQNMSIDNEGNLNPELYVKMSNSKYTEKDEKHLNLSRHDDHNDHTRLSKTDTSNDNLTFCVKRGTPTEMCYSVESSDIYQNKLPKSVNSFRQDCNHDESLSTSYASNCSSTSCVKRRTPSDVCYYAESSDNHESKTLKPETCSCDCCNGRCLHSPRKNNSNKLEVNKTSKKKQTSNALKSRIMSCNVNASNVFLTKTESVPKGKNKYLQNSVKELGSTTNESKQIGKRSKFAQSNAAIKQSLTYLLSSTQKPHVDKKDEKSKCNRGLIEEQKMKEINLVDDELVIHECNEKGNGAVQCDPNILLCLAFIFLALLLFVFVIFIFFFI